MVPSIRGRVSMYPRIKALRTHNEEGQLYIVKQHKTGYLAPSQHGTSPAVRRALCKAEGRWLRTLVTSHTLTCCFGRSWPKSIAMAIDYSASGAIKLLPVGRLLSLMTTASIPQCKPLSGSWRRRLHTCVRHFMHQLAKALLFSFLIEQFSFSSFVFLYSLCLIRSLHFWSKIATPIFCIN